MEPKVRLRRRVRRYQFRGKKRLLLFLICVLIFCVVGSIWIRPNDDEERDRRGADKEKEKEKEKKVIDDNTKAKTKTTTVIQDNARRTAATASTTTTTTTGIGEKSILSGSKEWRRTKITSLEQSPKYPPPTSLILKTTPPPTPSLIPPIQSPNLPPSPPKRRHAGKTMEDAKQLRANYTKHKKNSKLSSSLSIMNKIHIDPNTTNTTHPRMAFITYTHLNGTDRFHDFIFPALETWHVDNHKIPMFIVLSDIWKSAYHLIMDVQKDPKFIQHKHHMHIVWVACGEGKTFEPECCKQEQGMIYMLDQGYVDKFDWIIYLDDDNYIRTQYMRQYLATLPTDEHFVLTSGPQPRFLGIFGYLPQKSPYKCSKDPQYQFPWGQVIAYNRATMKHIQRGLRMHGLTKQCREFQVFHDVGNAVFHWMYQLPELRLLISDRPNEMRGELMGCHGIGRCFGTFTCFMDEVHEQLSLVFYHPPAVMDYKYEWRNYTGYKTTKNYETYGDPGGWDKEWHTMMTQDCLGPAKTK